MKNEQQIKDLIKQSESGQLEFKEVVRKEEIAKTICAFLNAEGGTVLIGVKNDGKIIGIEDADKYELELRHYLFKAIIPEPPIAVSVEKIGANEILSVKVWAGSKPPYIFNAEIFFRRGKHTVKASASEISRLITERQETELHWERQPALGVEIGDLDELEIRKTIQDLTKFGRENLFLKKKLKNF